MQHKVFQLQHITLISLYRIFRQRLFQLQIIKKPSDVWLPTHSRKEVNSNERISFAQHKAIVHCTIYSSMKKIIIINGPNLNLLGKRETDIYGTTTFEEFFHDIKDIYNGEVNLTYYQSNVEGELVNKLQETGFSFDGIILNAGGYTHTSVAIRDAIAAIKTPVVEVHISNIYAREEFRQHSLISAVCKGTIAGFGLDSYILALDSFLN